MIRCSPSAARRAEQSDGFGANQRVKPVQRFVEHQHRRVVAHGLGQLDALAHAFAVPGDLGVALPRSGSPVRSPASASRTRHGVRVSEEPQIRVDELVAREPSRERVELRAVTDLVEQIARVRSGRYAQHADAPARGPNQASHQVHQCRLARAVGPNQAGDAGRNREVYAIDAQHFSVKFGDVLENDCRMSRFLIPAPPRRHDFSSSNNRQNVADRQQRQPCAVGRHSRTDGH